MQWVVKERCIGRIKLKWIVERILFWQESGWIRDQGVFVRATNVMMREICLKMAFVTYKTFSTSLVRKKETGDAIKQKIEMWMPLLWSSTTSELQRSYFGRYYFGKLSCCFSQNTFQMKPVVTNVRDRCMRDLQFNESNWMPVLHIIS